MSLPISASNFHSYLYLSKLKFKTEYGKICGSTEAKSLYIYILKELKKCIAGDDINIFKEIVCVLKYIYSMECKITVTNYYNDIENPIKNTNFILLACQYNNKKILCHILRNFKFLNSLYSAVDRDNMSPMDKDEMFHNSFYYAMLSKNVDILDTLIVNWPDNYFLEHPNELDVMLATTYEELKLKNVPLSNEMELYVENKLIQLRFFCNSERCNMESNISSVKRRIALVLEAINLLQSKYLNINTVNDEFIFVAKFIAQNIHILKQQLKATYDEIPWEEIEFCLLTFVFSSTKSHEINIFILAILNKDKILKHLKNFANKLNNYTFIDNFNTISFLPSLSRDTAIKQIIESNPEFEDLYLDHERIRDIHSLMKIVNYITHALSADPSIPEGQLIIIRALQVIGEYTQDTWESPRLSNTTSELLLLSLPKNTRNITAHLCNSLSPAETLIKRTNIEKCYDVDIFIGIQKDIKKIADVITNIFYNCKIKIIRELLEKIINSKCIEEICEVTEIFKDVKYPEIKCVNLKMTEHEKLKKLILEFSNIISSKTEYEQMLFSKINDIIDFPITNLKNLEENYMFALMNIKAMVYVSNYIKWDENVMKNFEFLSNKALCMISSNIEACNLKNIAELSSDIFQSVQCRMHSNNNEIYRLMLEIFLIAQFYINDIKWIKQFLQKLNEKDSILPITNQRVISSMNKKQISEQFTDKLSMLKNILENKSSELSNFFTFDKSRKLQAAVEMLVLDIMSILDKSDGCLENNLLYIDDHAPVLVGKSLHDHLTHGNIFVDVAMYSDYLKALYFNAKNLISQENVLNKKIGKIIRDDPSRSILKYEQSLIILRNQEKMFLAIETGNQEELMCCLQNGSDIHGRNFKLWTALHFACKGSSLDILKFIIDQKLNLNAKNSDGENALHVAAKYNRNNIVEFLIKDKGMSADDITPAHMSALHIAAFYGHKETLITLLQNGANHNKYDSAGLLPLHYAVRSGHINAFKILLENRSVDIEIMGGFTSLHEASERGYFDFVLFLVKRGANIKKKTDQNRTPLHSAAFSGHLDIVKFLVSEGADVNAKVLDGCTPLHYATENAHENIVKFLLENGANVNVYDQTYKFTPLHFAAKDGCNNIVEMLLQNKANANAVTIEEMSALHFSAQNGHLEIVSILLKYNADINAKNMCQFTPLHFAVEGGHNTIIDYLIKNGASTTIMNYMDFTPLHMAALKGNLDAVKFLIKNNINTRTNSGQTLLHLAAINGSDLLVEFLLEKKIEINAKDVMGFTPLHESALNGNKSAVRLLIKYGANVNSQNITKMTPLHLAALRKHIEILDILIQSKANVNAINIEGNTPLIEAIEAGSEEAVKILVRNGSQVNIGCNMNNPLFHAVKCNHVGIVKYLISNNLDKDNINAYLQVAVIAGYQDIVEILLQNYTSGSEKFEDGATLLHFAANRGHKDVVISLIAKGAVIDAKNINNQTPLFLAAQAGFKDIVDILISNKSDVNIKDIDGLTPLHIAASEGHNRIVKTLLNNNSNINVKDNKNRTPIELAVAFGHLEVIQILSHNANINSKSIEGCTLLHVAAQENNVDIIKYLVDNGCDINSRNDFGSKPIHIAAKNCLRNNVEYFLNKGCSINDLGSANQTLLHYSIQKSDTEFIKFLLAHELDVNATDDSALTPMHIAASFGKINVIKVLLKNNAIFNPIDKLGRKPADMTENENIITLLNQIENLFKAINQNDPVRVKICIKNGAIINAKSAKFGTPLHYAAWKGSIDIVKILLQNECNPNLCTNKQLTPLHYACKFSYLEIVKLLLSNGAIYNAISDTGEAPIDFAVDRDIIDLLKLVEKSFEQVKLGNSKVIKNLTKIKNVGTVKAIMNTQNRQKKSLIVVALDYKFSHVNKLKEILQNDVSAKIEAATLLLNQNYFQEALSLFKDILEKREDILGKENPGSLDIQIYIAKVLYKQGSYQEAINMLEKICEKQVELLGENSEDVLNTRNIIALTLQRLGKNKESLSIYREVTMKQKEIFGTDHEETLYSELHMAIALNALEKYDEALNINERIYHVLNKRNSAGALNAQNNIALVLSNLGNYDKALETYKEVLDKKKKLLGLSHADTLRTMHNIALVLFKQQKHKEAVAALEEILNIQRSALGSNHPDTINSQHNMANVLFSQGMYAHAFKAFKGCFDRKKIIFGENHPEVLDISQKIEMISKGFKLQGNSESDILQYFENDNILIAAENGNLQMVQDLLTAGADVNDRDIEKRTPLHFAVNNGHLDIVNALLKKGGDPTLCTNKSDTPLHIAVSKDFEEIVKILLQSVDQNKLKGFINTQTAVGGNTALHIATKSGFYNCVLILLKHGAAYDIQNKEDKIPLQVSTHEKIITILNLLQELFLEAKVGSNQVCDKLKELKHDEFVAVTNARNKQGNTLLQVAICNKQRIATSLLRLIKCAD